MNGTSTQARDGERSLITVSDGIIAEGPEFKLDLAA